MGEWQPQWRGCGFGKQEELASLSRQFQNNVLDSTKDYKLTLTEPVQIIGSRRDQVVMEFARPTGLPPRVLAQAAERARAQGHPAATGTRKLKLSLVFRCVRSFRGLLCFGRGRS